MTLIRTSLLNSIAVVIRVLSALVLNKMLAIYVGPSGYAVIGQFQNFVAMLTMLSSGAVNTGVTKYTAEYFDDQIQQISIWKAAAAIALCSSVGFGLVITILRRPLASWILKDESFASVFVWLGAGLVLFTLNSLLLAILNGKKEINRFVVINIAGSLVGLVVTGGLATWGGLYGALVALSINQSIIFGVTLAICLHTPWFHLRNLIGKFDPLILPGLGKFALMGLTSAVCVPTSQILIRNHLGTNFGWEAAGQWEAVMRISNLYLMVVTIPLAVYYLPRLSEIRGTHDLKQEIAQGYRILLPLTIVGALIIYLLRDWIILTLFSSDFAPMQNLFAWQLAGDVVKIGSWLPAHVMLAHALTRVFIITEIVFSVVIVLFVILFTFVMGFSSVSAAYCMTYVLYWICMGFVIRKHMANIDRGELGDAQPCDSN